MLSPITAETFKTLVFDAGMLLVNFDFKTANDAQSLIALVTSSETQKKSWLGATKGGVNVQENREWWSPEMDGLRMPYKGMQRPSTAAPKMTGTLVEFRPMNVKLASGAAEITGEDTNVITVQPKASIKANDYLDNVDFIGDNGEDGLYLVELKNAICTSGINTQTADKDIGTIPFEFSGNSDSPVFTDDLPVKYMFFKASASSTEATDSNDA